MKIAILILSANTEICDRNKNAIVDTYVNQLFSKEREHEYNVFFYSGDAVDEYINHDHDNKFSCISLTAKDDIYNTFEKTIDAFKAVYEYNDYDYIIRCNISAFINVELLDAVMSSATKGFIYCNAINTVITNIEYLNDIYPRGDFYIIGRDDVKGVIEKSSVFYGKYNDFVGLDHVDDVLVGMSYILYKGDSYYDYIKSLIYNYIPCTMEQGFDINSISPYAICSRVKTLPPDVSYSGYSWEDNVYRLDDVKKMHTLSEYTKGLKYERGDINKLVIPDDKTRHTPVSYITNVNVGVVKSILKNKRA